MVGSTLLSERLDPEDFGDLLNSYQRVCRDAIVRYEGHVSQFLGDGLLAYFGYPAAHEDDAVRAIRAALSILDTTVLINRGIGRRLDAEVHVRVGIHTGVVVISEGVGNIHERLAVGETVNLAARIETSAPINSVVVSATTAHLAGGHFEFESLRTQMLRGFSRPVELLRVVRPTGARTQFEAATRGRLTPHINREAELEELTATWHDVQNGATRIVLVSGEAGVGKSRLLHHFRRTALAESVTVLECLCTPLTQATALAPIIEMLDQRLLERLEGSVTPRRRLEALQAMVAEHSRFGPDALPLIAALLSIPGADNAPVAELSPVRRRLRTLELLRDWLISSAERVPVALLFEDLQWADPSTLDFLDLLVRDAGSTGARALLCMTMRPEAPRRWDESRARHISLARLPAESTNSMIAQIDGGDALSHEMVRRIAERSEGVPLYIEEITKLVVDRLRSNVKPRATPSQQSLLPSTLRGALEARLDQVGTGRRIAQLGAAIGREFSYALIRAVAGGDEEQVQRDLKFLSQSELAYVQGEHPHSTYTFKHALIQDAIYETIPKRNRESFHQRIYVALIDDFPELVEARPEMGAYHAERAGEIEPAVRLLQRAGRDALARQAVVEAVRHLRHGLDLVEMLDDDLRINMELELQAAIGPAYMATLGWAAEEVEQSSARLLDLATLRGNTQMVYLAMWSLWSVHFVRGELDAAIGVAQKVYDMALAVGDPMLRITACHAFGYTLYYRADFEAAKKIATEALALSTLEIERASAAMFQLSSGSIVHGFCAAAQWLLGEQDQAAERMVKWRELLSSLKHAASTALSLAFEGYLLHMQREPKKLRELAIRLRTISEQEGFRLWISMSHVFEAWAVAQEGQVSIAVERMNSAIDAWLTTNSRLTMCDNTVMQAEVLLLAGHAEDALATIGQGKEICAKLGERTLEPELYRLEGEAFELLGRRPEALAATQYAVQRAKELRALSLELRGVLQLHRWLANTESLEQLRDTYSRFSEGFDQPDLKQARAYLIEAGEIHAERAHAG